MLVWPIVQDLEEDQQDDGATITVIGAAVVFLVRFIWQVSETKWNEMINENEVTGLNGCELQRKKNKEVIY